MCDNIEMIKEDIERIKRSIKPYQQELEKAEERLQKANWMQNRDMLKLGEMEIGSNQDSWIYYKKNNKQPWVAKPFYMGIRNEHKSTGLTLHQAKELRDYLNVKIEYIES